MPNHTIISADSHMVEPPDLWTSRLDKKFRDSAPRVEDNEKGTFFVAPGIPPIGPMTSKFFGEDNYMWASDFPHTDCTWPNSRNVIERDFAGVPDAVRENILCRNAARTYGIALEN